MVQFIFLSPLLYYIIEKYIFKGIIGIFTLNLIYEISITLGLALPYYTHSIIKYLFIISVGMYYSKCFINSSTNDYTLRKIILYAFSFIIGFFILLRPNIYQGQSFLSDGQQHL